LVKDPNETKNIIDSNKEIAKRMIELFTAWSSSVDASDAGKDYPNGHAEPNGYTVSWVDLPEYRPYFEQWKSRPEYKGVLKNEN
jgi:hypothetical protein